MMKPAIAMLRATVCLLALGCLPLLSPTVATSAERPLVLVLPFQVNAGPEMPNASRDVPQQIAAQMEASGLRTVPMDKARQLVQSLKDGTLNLAAARKLGREAGASLVVYGSFNQLGNGFSMDTRTVPVDRGEAVPDRFERNSLTALSECAATLAGRANTVLGSGPSQLPPKSGPGTVPMVAPDTKGGLADVQIRGMQIMDPDTVLMRLTIRRGDRPDQQAINDEIKRIWDMGYFSDVQAHLEGNVLIFTVTEKPRIDNIVVEGSDNIDKDDVLAAMSTKAGNVLNEQMLADDLQKISELYRKEGYYLAQASYKLQDRQGPQGGSVLVISVNEGKKLYITEVKVEGLHDLKQGDMEKYMALRPRGILSWFTGTGTLKEEYLERDTNAIAAYGLNEGYVDIQVSAPEIQYLEDGIHVIFHVHEGPRYTVRSVKFAGDVIDSEERMREVIEMDDWSEKEKYFSLTVMQEDAKKLTEYYTDYGYAFAEVDTRLMKANDGSAQVDVGYMINKKQKVYIRRLMVEGNTKTRDNVILREMRLGDGDMYEGAKLRRSTERLNRLRYFSAVDTELIPTGVEDEVDLKVKVKEANTGALMGGIGYSTYYDVGVSASIMERNLFGRGYWLQLQGFFSWRRTSGMLSFTNPRVYDTELSAGNDIYYIHDYWDDFTKETIGDTIRLAYPIGEYTSVGISYRLERYILSDVDAGSSPYIADYEGTNWTSALSGRILRDTTDIKERPTKGTIARLWAEYGGGGLGGTDNFVKAVADWQGFWSFNPENTIHVRGRIGGVFQNTGDKVPVFERFWLGGMDTIRGYTYSDISPRDYENGHGEHIGGDRMGVVNLEYIWTFQKELGLAIVPFLDGGFNVDQKTMNKGLNEYMVYSTGLELRWRSPMGDLRIAYGYPLSKDYDNERTPGRLEFSMGQFF
ncbi:MAG: outer membrane protein assembly factor BamA [Desulfovibrio sp.]|jgi:outer membrane protein insertion porin family|nr:outer membrane protein assembly factor BamA [Desulfovibrio sp.]